MVEVTIFCGLLFDWLASFSVYKTLPGCMLSALRYVASVDIEMFSMHQNCSEYCHVHELLFNCRLFSVWALSMFCFKRLPVMHLVGM